MKRLVALMAAATLLGGCAGLLPAAPEPPAPAAVAPPAWQATLPHGGQPTELASWWTRFDDPALPGLIAAAQEVSPTVASAGARIAEARAARVAAGAALGPTADASAAAVRTRADVQAPVVTTGSLGLAARWEIDLFGGAAAARDAAQARVDGAQARWHDARVSVAAEVARTLLSLRACESQLVQTELDAASRSETARLTQLSARAGLEAPATADLARASAAQARERVTRERASCDLDRKALVALTGIDETALIGRLAEGQGRMPQPSGLVLDAVPAEALAQRPDLRAAALELTAAARDITAAEAQRYPQLALDGSISATRVRTGGISDSGTVWSLGPVSVSVPLFDGGRRAADADAARARYDEALSGYRAAVRTAVRDVEEALVALDSTARRSSDALEASEGYERSLIATEARYRAGLASLFVLEEARRTAVLARSDLIGLQRDRASAWIALYRAVGGGWTPERSGAAAMAGSVPPLP